jgi:hypothetical protein
MTRQSAHLRRFFTLSRFYIFFPRQPFQHDQGSAVDGGDIRRRVREPPRFISHRIYVEWCSL